VRLTFPRHTEREGLCLSDYFLPADSSKFDVVAFRLVPEASTSALVVHHPAAMYYMVKV
jgi:cobalamin-dependent methionine synthase I